ncbi:TIGR04282 family arsenosugar biosynthesis glycosyltransferase [Hymenobacter sp. BT770]|uniref:TIGR04282 family arsenosugar biosynthesis glycosyltransferase n=1 Tax=Hymenobacter sp. BT770 TaxID=2886942 RepID=UPI001D12A455|nr:TIGR04282 family arsenosugar biosynthesis glycosyltransferase [Hymenobacter sp. BT770]MCC3152456.1 TIGR04282 family arsenosugar biosynthesis glycosyltransferase [Hymenobacter sp. BT770]MDO3414568.1 TIGR04282 family arsenosugar biosynthesis glycosyltransferase [Hymenobacter sp. BT770]
MSKELMDAITTPTSAVQLLVFARVPALGQVKTRLAAGVGDTEALAIYHELLGITRAAIAEAGVAATVWLAGTAGPEPTALEAQEWAQLTARSQQAGDLGQRMTAAFAAAFAAGAEKVAIIGTDCPGLRPEHLTEAFALLSQHDVVLGPATDGGYYLLGLRQPQPELFQNKAWSTETVLADTVADARRLGRRVALLPELHDVDTAEDLATWRAAIEG